MPNYGDPRYWDDRYEKSGKDNTFDWLESYETLKSLLEQFLTRKDSRILILGCGNAEFSEELYDAGFTNIVNVDISSVVIQQMNERNSELRPQMTFQVMDITDMSEFESNSFDFAIDKSTIDALLCGDDSFVKVAMMLKETQRVLKTGGIYFAISYGKPESRSFHFVQPFLALENREFILYESGCTTEEEKAERSHYIYVSTKLENADEVSALHFESCIEQLRLDAEIQRQIEEDGELPPEESDEETKHEPAQVENTPSQGGADGQGEEEKDEEETVQKAISKAHESDHIPASEASGASAATDSHQNLEASEQPDKQSQQRPEEDV